MKRRRPWLLVAWACTWAVSSAVADLPSVEVRVDTNRVTVGDPIRLSLVLRYRAGERPSLPSLNEWLQEFSPRLGERREAESGDGAVQLAQPFELRLFELGTKQIPPLDVGFIQATGDTLVRSSLAVDIEVVSARGEEDEGPRDIKPPVAVPGGVPLWLVVLLVAALLGLMGGGVYWSRRRRGQTAEPPPPPEPVDHAAEFIRIAGMGLIDKGDFKTYYSLLADNLRRFLEQSLEVEAMEQTTVEIVGALQKVELEAERIQDVREFLGFADLVKFARRVPAIEQARRAPEVGVALVRAIDRWLRIRQAQAESEPVDRAEEEPAPVSPSPNLPE